MTTTDALSAAVKQHKQGDLQAALAVYERLCVEQPDNAEILRYLGLAKFQTGYREQGLRALQRATAAAPGYASAWSDRGRMHAVLGQPEQALECLERAVAANPEYAEGWHNLGVAKRRARDSRGALAAYQRALAIDPERADTYLNIGNLLVDDNQPDAAIERFRRAAALSPKLGQARASLANQLSGRGDVSDAEFIYRQAVALNPEHVQAWFGLGRTLEDLGQARESGDCYRRVLTLQPGQPFALGQLLALKDTNLDDDIIAAAQQVMQDATTADAARALIGYGLGKALDRRKDYQAAFTAFRGANRARRAETGEFDVAQFEQRIGGLIDSFTPEFFGERARFGIGTDQPVFIVGMPRSGTTLTEQILHSHPQMVGAGELAYLSETVSEIPGRFGLDAAWPQCAAELTKTQSQQAAHSYLEKLRSKAPDTVMRVSDKSPLNFFHLGLVALLFPNARVVHCSRNPIDTCLSIYFENFRANQTWATELSDLAVYYRSYQRLMTHWRAVLPLKMLELPYEQTVADLDAGARKLVKFLGVGWDARCLDFHQSARAVQTPSRWQVRQPIYNTSVMRWRHYESYLGPLVKAFPEWARR